MLVTYLKVAPDLIKDVVAMEKETLGLPLAIKSMIHITTEALFNVSLPNNEDKYFLNHN